MRSRPGPSPSFAPGREERRAPSWQDGFSVSGYVQAQYEQNQLSEDQLDASAAPLNSDRFVLRRGRVRLDKRWQYAQAVLELDANTVRGLAVGIRRAEASLVYRRGNADLPVLALTAGILDIPFGYELAESPRTRPFFERSTTSLALFPSEADLGVKLWGAFGFARYAVAITNGEPLDARGFPRDPNRAKDVSGRLGIDLQVQRRLALAAGTSFSFGKGFHAGQVGTKGGVTWRDDNENGAVDAGELIGVPASAPEPSKNFERFALGLDLRAVLSTPLGSSQLAFEGYLASNQDRALYPADPVQTGVDLRESGFSISFVQDVYRYGLIGLRYSLYDPNADWLDQRQGNFQPRSAAVRSVSPVIGLNLADYARLLFQYDFVRDRLARDPRGVPADANNNWFGVRLQVGL
ncbi:MAG TPA: hypothetical protein VFQ61_26910 [Polyangiaceae bacterium]|nr:hypothetical protein [Polyangiaceae bacterium]